MGQEITTPFSLAEKAAGEAKTIAYDAANAVGNGLYNVGALYQDTIRTGATVVDNVRGDGLSTVRQFESDAAAVIDSAIDNVNTTVNTISVAFFDTVQVITLLVFAGAMIFLLFYGDKIFANGIRLGKINLI